MNTTTHTVTLNESELELLTRVTHALYPPSEQASKVVAHSELLKCTLKIAAIRGLERIIEIMGTKEVT